MATKKKAPAVEEEELVEEVEFKPSEVEYEMVPYTAELNRFTAHRGDVFVSINGKAKLIKRGETVMLPKNYYNVLKRSEQAEQEYVRKSMQLAQSLGKS